VPHSNSGAAQLRCTVRAVADASALAPSPMQRLPTWAIACASTVPWAGYMVYARLGARFSLDLRVYRAAAAALLAGHNPYHGLFTGHHLPFTYPPIAVVVFVPLSRGSVHLVEALWWLINSAAMVAILSIAISATFTLARKRTLAIALFLTPVLSLAFEPVRTNTNYGQINALLFLLVLLDITLVRGRGRGVLVGIAAAIKLTPLVYLIYFAVGREWRALMRGLVAFAGLGAAVWLVLPRESDTFWFHQVLDPSRTGHVGSVRNQSLDGLLHRWPFGPRGSDFAWAILVLVVVAAGTLLARRLISRGRVIDAVVALGLTGDLASPISWTHHWIWIAIIPVLLVRGFKGQPAVVAAMVLLCLVGTTGSSTSLQVVWVEKSLSDSLVLAGGLLLFTWLVSEVRLRYVLERGMTGAAPNRPSAPGQRIEELQDQRVGADLLGGQPDTGRDLGAGPLVASAQDGVEGDRHPGRAGEPL
jgi:alpha-1,2-mannosyltransferase